MIDKETLIRLAKINGLKPWQQEKHYVQALILAIIAEKPVVFKGGTYLWFFHGLKRFSEDLDFTVSEKGLNNTAETVSKDLELFGIENKLKIIADNERSLSFRISAKGPLNTGEIDLCRVYVEISRREPITKKALPIKADFPAYQLPVKHIQGMDLEEVGAEKVRAIFSRDKARDFYDLFFLVKEKGIAFNEALIEKKLEYYDMHFARKTLLQKMKARQKYFSKELGNIVFGELPKFSYCFNTIKKWPKKQRKNSR
ncbi:MAG: nucleotidyl transferase AbiEii/AbiGii toxin family protein [Candidatus Diapherotrites archaeon]